MNKTPIEIWIETWGTNLDWEAKAKLREAVAEMFAQDLEQRVSVLEKEIAELKVQVSARQGIDVNAFVAALELYRSEASHKRNKEVDSLGRG